MSTTEIEPTWSDSDEIACPVCGELCCDLWDYHWRSESIEIECPSCDAPLTLVRNISIDYTAQTREAVKT